ncbi:MAG: histidine phosphatase family protein [Candidatus Woykebacteria bacterium]
MRSTAHYVRHSVYDNPDGIEPGRIPGLHLTAPGEKKAEKTVRFFKGKPIVHIYTSPLERAYETANIIAKAFPKVPITHSYELTEADSTYWQAYKYEMLFNNNYYEAFLTDPDAPDLPENLTALAERMKKFALTICQKHTGQEIICVSHEFPILALRLSLEEKPLQLLRSYNISMASITSFVFDENCRLVETSYTEMK